jgi:uncharacterized protein HemY
MTTGKGPIFIAFLAALALGACSGKQAAEALNDDTMSVMRDRAGDADLLVGFLNRRTLLFNGDIQADRISVISARLKNAGCRSPVMRREHAEEQDGTWSFGRKRVVYYSEWTCG